MGGSRTQRLLSVLLVVLAAGCSRPHREAPGDLVPIVLQTDWFPQAEHGGFYQALVNGYYEDEGLDVEILPGGPGAMIKHKVVQGTAQFAMNRSDDIAVAVDRGLPLVMVFAVLQRDPQALMMHPENAVTRFEDLDGRTVVASPGLNWIAYLESRYDIRLNVQPHTYGLTQFLKDPALVQQCFATNEPFYVRQQGLDPVVLMLSDSGFEPYHVIFTSRDFANENPGVVAAFTRASIRGWESFLEGDPTQAFAMIAERNPQMTTEFLEFSRDTMIERRLVTGNEESGDAVGQLDPDRIQREVDQLLELGIISEPLSAEELTIAGSR